jgi:hypothetical protein
MVTCFPREESSLAATFSFTRKKRLPYLPKVEKAIGSIGIVSIIERRI